MLFYWTLMCRGLIFEINSRTLKSGSSLSDSIPQSFSRVSKHINEAGGNPNLKEIKSKIVFSFISFDKIL